jgi:hypothetical protein
MFQPKFNDMFVSVSVDVKGISPYFDIHRIQAHCFTLSVSLDLAKTPKGHN